MNLITLFFLADRLPPYKTWTPSGGDNFRANVKNANLVASSLFGLVESSVSARQSFKI